MTIDSDPEEQINSDASWKGRLRRMLTIVLLAVIAGYFGLLALLYVMQDSLIFFPTANYIQTPTNAGWEFEEVWLVSGGEETYGWFIPTDEERRGTLLFSHGNAGNIGDRLESVRIFRSLGYDVLIYDYGGYGASSGRPSEQRFYDDIRAMWNYLTVERCVPDAEIVLFGRSLGSGPTSQLATEVSAHRVILESVFRSVPEMAHDFYPWLPVRSLVRTRFDNEYKVGSIGMPLLVVHSSDDEIISYSHGRKIYDFAAEPKFFLELVGGHNSAFIETGQAYVNGLEDFLSAKF